MDDCNADIGLKDRYKKVSSDSSMDDCNGEGIKWIRKKIWVQIPLWTIVTRDHREHSPRKRRSDSSMDDCNADIGLKDRYKKVSSDSSMDDCNSAAVSFSVAEG